MKPVSVFKVCLRLSGFGYINAIKCIPQAVVCFYLRSAIDGFEVTFVISATHRARNVNIEFMMKI